MQDSTMAQLDFHFLFIIWPAQNDEKMETEFRQCSTMIGTLPRINPVEFCLINASQLKIMWKLFPSCAMSRQARPGHTIHLNLLKIINQPNLVQHPVDYVRVMFDRLRIRLAINRMNLLFLNIIINIGQIFSLFSSKLHVHYSNCSSLFMIVFHLS